MEERDGKRRGAGTGSGKRETGSGDGTFGTGSGNREKEEASKEVGRGRNVVDRLSTVNVSYPRVDYNSS